MDDVRLKQELVSVFDRAAPDFDQSGVEFFGPVAARLVEHAGVRPGHHVLDVGCGRGAVLFAAAEAAGADGRVTGIDLASEMVRETAFDVRRRGLENVAVEVMDGEQPSFAPGTFDAVLGSFSIVLLPHAVEALPRYRALLREGGVLAFSGPSFEGDGSFPFTWSSLPRTLLDLFDDVLQRMGGQDVVQSTMGWVAGADRIRESLAGAGFAGVAIHEEEVATVIGSGDEWVRWSWTTGMRIVWEAVPEEDRPRLEARVAEEIESGRGADGSITLSMPVRFVVAR